MDNNQAIRKWSELYKLDVVVPGEGKALGKVEDFFFKEGSNAIYALCVRTRLHGDLSLPVTGIVAIEKDKVTIRNAQMLARALPPLARGQQLLSRKVVGTKDKELGTVKDVVLSVEPPITTRIVGYEMLRGSSSTTFGSDVISHYNDEDNSIRIYDQSAKSLR
ncbi:PRC-barrel domain-containing protein [Dictyobacter kobayashii]|uniref:PRC-barrel domain-containing protein n=1 Tax=Dictyobacter kobayashii TaxID=2014872 RepID=A0A402AII1_9CHLR|nr:PRC-barrel domain-containing protein [Dictyobacter kobayashii]GCE18922.1 hypothetical protein KDK_27220 [Dictyobacter kobayashii]